MKNKRLIIASLLGIVFGFVCFGFASSGSEGLQWSVAVQIILSRTLIGVAIGLSFLSFMHWTLHGMLMGFIFSLPLAFSGFMAPDNPEFSKTMMFISTIILGMVYGILIELITSVIFKARIAEGSEHPKSMV